MLKATIHDISDEELIRGCMSGNEKNFRLMYDRHYGKMFNICRRYARDRHEASDMVQEGFIRIFMNITQFKNEGSFEGWMKRVMITSCINYFNKYNSKQTLEFRDHLEKISYENGHSKHNEGDDDSPVMSKINADALLQLVQQLPPAYRMVFNLFAIDGYSHLEIARQLNISEGTSRSNLKKARMKLMELIKTTGYQKV
jgi:RNA polymerase sigma-70 factor (ECF subfamily)